MKKSQTLPAVGAAIGMLILILDGKTAIAGAQDGIELCIRTLIPSLFPFFILSGLLTGTLTGQPMPLLRPIGRLCGIPSGAESLLAVGFLGGYPVGAANVALAYRQGQLTKSDAERMLPFCSNAGPAFLFGILSSMFSDLKTVWFLWGVHILSALLVGILTKQTSFSAASVRPHSVRLTEALEQAVKVMSLVCGWVVLFRVVLEFLNRWVLWLLPGSVPVLVSGILELSNGCVALGGIETEGLRFLMAGVLLSFGGVCVTMQTASAASGLSLRPYLSGKLLQSCFSFWLCIFLQFLFPAAERWNCPAAWCIPAAVFPVILVFFLKRSEKTSSNPVPLSV